MDKRLISGLKAGVFFLCLILVFLGQKHIGYSGLLAMLAGLIGLLVLLWDYNRKYQ
ncbi:DUF6903 family protein [Enterococcus sp. LJL128]|uniref:DUF6903 family protein n=1 Tax=Enterococcus sp. LJL51 TaxID=3416656 RepID=UPI003CFA095F